MVETQAKCATNRLVGSLEEQQTLEALLDESKPPAPLDSGRLDYLLFTPFRYASYPTGSRFRRPGQPDGVFYASETTDTMAAENAFHALLFYAESPGTRLPSKPAERTAFSVPCRTRAGIDLTVPPLDRDLDQWMAPADYAPCQDLADSARTASVEVIRYCSVRDPAAGFNIAILACAAFAANKPAGLQTWHVALKPAAVQLWCEAPRISYEFELSAFSDDPRIAAMIARR